MNIVWSSPTSHVGSLSRYNFTAETPYTIKLLNPDAKPVVVDDVGDTRELLAIYNGFSKELLFALPEWLEGDIAVFPLFQLQHLSDKSSYIGAVHKELVTTERSSYKKKAEKRRKKLKDQINKLKKV